MHNSILHPLYFTVLPQTGKVTERAHGLDVSKYDLSYDPARATVQTDFAVQRTSYRLTRDERLETIWEGVKKVPIRLAYHYFNFGYAGDKTWREQVAFFRSLVKEKSYHGTAWDFEEGFNIMSLKAAVDSYSAIQELEQTLGMPCFLYTSLGLYDKYIYPTTLAPYNLPWNNVKLWLAQWWYTPNPNGTPSRPKGRNQVRYWDIWQYTDKGRNMGTGRDYPTDLDVYNGAPEQMMRDLNISGTPPPTGDEKMFFKCVKDVAYRNEAKWDPNGSGSTVLGALRVGDIVEGARMTNPNDTIKEWIRFTKIYRAGSSLQETLTAYCSSNPVYMIETEFIPPGTEPPTENSIWVKTVIQDVDDTGKVTARYETDNVEAKKVS